MKTRTKRMSLGWCIALMCAFMFAQAPAAEAGDAGFIFEIDTASAVWFVDSPHFDLTNTSVAGITLDEFSLTVGDTSYQFDIVFAPTVTDTGGGLLTPTLTAPNPNVNADFSSDDVMTFTYTGFDRAESVAWIADMDLDGANGVITVNPFFDNGQGNATFYAEFSNGEVYRGTIPDQSPGVARFRVGNQIPEPTSLALLGLGAIGFAIRRRRRKTA